MTGGAVRAALAAAFALAGAGCQRPGKDAALGTVRLGGGAAADPAFDDSWRRLSARPGPEGEVFYIEDDRGEGLMGRVRRAPRALPRPAPAPESLPDAAPAPGEAEMPSGEHVAQVVRANLQGVKVCYLRLARAGSRASGRAILSFTVGKEGGAENVRVDAPTFEDTDLPVCMTRQVERWSFPRSRKGGLAVTYPFVFVGG